MFFRRKPKGGIGSNQYQSRGESHQHPGEHHHSGDIEAPILAGPDLCAQVSLKDTGAGRRRCGEVWGSDCRHWIEPPDYSHGDHPTSESMGEAARGDSTPLYLLERLAVDPERWIRCGVAENRTAPPDLLDQLVEDANAKGDLGVLVLVARNTSTSLGTLERLASIKDPWLREGLACNHSVTPEILEDLSADEAPWVRKRVAGNYVASPATLERLALDQDWEVRMCVAGNPSTAPSALGKLASDRKMAVLEVVAENPSCPADSLARLTGHRYSSVARAALYNPSLPEHIRELAQVIHPLDEI